MPGGRLSSFRAGDSAERLAEFLIGTFAFTTAVPRQEDIGHDLHCVLSEPDESGRFLHAGPFFTMQVKSSHEPLVYETQHQIDWIWEQDNPFFICVVNRAELRCEVFATWNLLNAVLLHPKQRIALEPWCKIDPAAPSTVDTQLDMIRVPLGHPVVSFDAHQAVDRGWSRQCSTLMKPWIELDRRNIVERRASMYGVLTPTEWTTNEPLDAGANLRVWHYANPNNFLDVVSNLDRAAGAYRRVVSLIPDFDQSPYHQELQTFLQLRLREYGLCDAQLADDVN